MIILLGKENYCNFAYWLQLVSTALFTCKQYVTRNSVRGRFKIKNTIICGKSPKGGGSGPKSKKSTFQM